MNYEYEEMINRYSYHITLTFLLSFGKVLTTHPCFTFITATHKTG